MRISSIFQRNKSKKTIAERVVAVEEFTIPEAGQTRNLMVEAIHIRIAPSDFRRAVEKLRKSPNSIDDVMCKMKKIGAPVWIEGEPYPGQKFGLIFVTDPDSSSDLIHIAGWTELKGELFFIPILAKWSGKGLKNKVSGPDVVKNMISTHLQLRDTQSMRLTRRAMSLDSGFEGVNLVDFFGSIMRECVLFAAAVIADGEIFVTE